VREWLGRGYQFRERTLEELDEGLGEEPPRGRPYKEYQFTRSALVERYKPFIWRFVRKFLSRNPWLAPKWLDIRMQALRLAEEAEKKFKPELGHDFSTYLRHRLKRLHRLNGLDRYRGRRTDRTIARSKFGRGKDRVIDWSEHLPALRKLRGTPLRPTEKAVLRWMLDRKGTLTQVAAANGIHKSTASKIQYRLLLRSCRQSP
jgi:hypothetical protein